MKKNRLLVLLLFAVFFMATTTLNAQTTTTIDVGDDTWVSQEEPDANKGDAGADMQVSMDAANSKTYETYIKFDLSSLNGFVTNAVLKIRADQKGDAGWTDLDKQTIQVYACWDDSWTEDALTWNNKPVAKKLLAEIDIIDPSDYISISSSELTQYVNSALLNDKRTSVTFVFKAKDDTPGSRVWISSKEWKKPMLDVTTTEISNTISDGPDDWVNEQDPDAANGGSTDMNDLNVTKITGNSREAYVRFDLSEVTGEVTNAAVMFYGAQKGDDGWSLTENFYVQIVGCDDDAWEEDAITWNTKPEASTSALDEANIITSKWWTFNDPAIAGYINGLIRNGKTSVTFILQGKEETPGSRIWVSSKGWKAPKLQLITEEVESTIQSTNGTWVGKADPDAKHEEEGADMNVMTNGDDIRMGVISFDLTSIPGYSVDDDNVILSDVMLKLRGDQWTGDDHPEFVKLPHFYVEVLGLNDKKAPVNDDELTWNTMPDMEKNLTSNSLATIDVSYSGWYAIASEEITNYVNDAILDRRSSVVFVLRAKDDIANTRAWFSDEQWKKPELHFNASVTDNVVIVEDDTWVGQQEPDATHDGETDMQISNNNGNAREAYIKFPIAGIGTAKEVALRLKGAPKDDDDWTPSDHFIAQISGVSDNEWAEADLTWNTKPDAGNAVAQQNVNYSGWHTFTSPALTAYINNAIANGDQYVSFAVQGANETPTERIWLSDKGWSKPALAIVGDAPAEPPADPVIAVASGTYSGQIEVAITSATEGVNIFYTLDGSEPTNASTKYDGMVKLSESVTIKAIAYNGSVPSAAVASAEYTILPAQLKIDVAKDVWVEKQNPDTQHEGGDADMNIVKTDDDERFALISFDVTDITGYVSNASLHLRGDQKVEEGVWSRIDDFFIEVYAVYDEEWTGDVSVTWNNKPDTDQLLGEENIKTSGWHILSSDELAAYVNSIINDDDKDVVSFAVKAKESTPGSRVWISSQEWAGPKLSLTTMEEGTKITVKEDSYVTEAEPNTNHDSSLPDETADMSVTKIEGASRQVYLKFDISQATKASGIALLLKGAQHGKDDFPTTLDHFYVDVYGCDNNVWSELALMWVNKPDISTDVLASTDITSSMWHTFAGDALTQYINSKIEAGEQYVTLAVVGRDNTPDARCWFSDQTWAAPNLRFYFGGSADVAVPVFDPAPGLYPPPSVEVTMTTETDGADIYYTTDGSVPTEEATKYEGPITINEIADGVVSMEFRVVAIKDGMRSYMTEAKYSVGTQQPYHGEPVTVPGTIEAWAYDIGGQDVAYHEDSPDKMGQCGATGVSIQDKRTDNGSIDGCCDEGKGCGIGWGATDEWTEYTISNATEGCFVAQLRYVKASASAASIQIDEYDNDNNLIKNLVPVTELAQNAPDNEWGTNPYDLDLVNLGTVFELSAGTHIIRVTWIDPVWNFVEMEIHPSDCPAQPVTGVSLNTNTLTLASEGTATLTASVKPADAADKTVTWKSSDENVATVDDNGVVTAVAEGEATITVTTNDGDYTAECVVTVKTIEKPVTGVSLDQTQIDLEFNGSVTLTATVEPDDASIKDVTWSSSDEDVASVDQSGVVTWQGDGTATITVTTEDGGFTATCTIQAAVGIEDLAIKALENARLYPNPTRNNLNIELNAENAFDATLYLMDVTGRKLKIHNVEFAPGNNIKSINMSAYKEGIYFIGIIKDNKQVVKRFALIK